MMKNKMCVSLACLIVAASLTACTDDNKDSFSSTSPDVEKDNSFYSINYTNTNDSAMSRSNSTSTVERSSTFDSKSEGKNSNNQNSGSQSETRRSSNNTSSKSDSASSQLSSSEKSDTKTTKTTITYYYYDEDGAAHSTDSEIDTEETAETDIESESQTYDSDSDSDISSKQIKDTDTATDAEQASDSDTNHHSEPSTEVDTDVVAGEFTEEDLIFIYDNTEIVYGKNIESIIEGIGEPLHIENIPNENDPQHDRKIYNYEHFSIETAPDESGVVYTVVETQIFDDSIKTSKGAHIGMSINDAAAPYGDNMMIYGDEYRYYIGSRFMYFYVQNEIVANIGYGYDSDIPSSNNEGGA